MGPGGGKTSTGTSSSPYAPLIASIGQQMWKMAKPVDQQMAAQTGEALRTGGINARIPMINNAMGAARQAYSGSYWQTHDALARSGLLNSSFGEGILANLQQSGGQQIAGIPTDVASGFISQGAPAVENLGNAGVGALGTAGGLDTNWTQTPSFMDYMMQGMQAGAMGGGAAAAFAGG